MKIRHFFIAAILVWIVSGIILHKIKDMNIYDDNEENFSQESISESQSKEIFTECVYRSYILACNGVEAPDAKDYLDKILQDSISEDAKKIFVIQGYSIYENYGKRYLSQEKILKEKIQDSYYKINELLKKSDNPNRQITI
jgi:hypothetical protein